MAKTFFRGISFPFRKSSTSLPAAASDDELINQSLLQIITTGKQERVMRPDFGTNVYSYVFENNDLIFEETIRADIMAAIAKYETRVIVQSVDAERDDTSATVTIRYVNVSTRETGEISVDIPRA